MRRIVQVACTLAALVASGCSDDVDDRNRSVDAVPQPVERAPETDCGINEPGRLGGGADLAAATRVVELYARHGKRCPTQREVEELVYIWKQNVGYWSEFPIQAERFFETNVAGGHGVLREWVGASFEVAKRALLGNREFPLTQDRGPTVVGDMTLYELSGGMSVYLVVVRDEKVSSIYLFDQT